VPIALAVMAAIVAVGSVNGFTHVNPRDTPGAELSYRPPTPGQRVVLVVSGYGSHWNGGSRHPVPGPFFEQQFSYRGLGPRGRPLSYASGDTVQPLAELDAKMAAQVAVLHHDSGRDVDIVAESEGALVAKTYLVSHPSPPVATAVLASPLLGPGRVSYPVGTSQRGFGWPSAYAMQLLGSLYKSVAPIDLSPDSAFLKSVDQLAPLLKNVLSCPTPGIREFALLPLADATAAPARTTLPFPSVVVPAFHGGLVGSPSTGGTIAAALEGRNPAPSGVLRDVDSVVSASASAWQVPALPLSDYARAAPGGGALAPSCRALAVALRT
jgi:hypothetical protein